MDWMTAPSAQPVRRQERRLYDAPGDPRAGGLNLTNSDSSGHALGLFARAGAAVAIRRVSPHGLSDLERKVGSLRWSNIMSTGLLDHDNWTLGDCSGVENGEAGRKDNSNNPPAKPGAFRM